MPPTRSHLQTRFGFSAVIAALFLAVACLFLPDAAGQDSAPAKAPVSQGSQVPASNYDPAIFQNSIPSEQLAFLNRFAGAKARDLIRDKQFRKVMQSMIPDCMFHYGWDMPPADAFDKVFAGSNLPVQIREGRYITVAGRSGPYLQGRGFLWIDMRDGIALSGFYFHPTNGEPTPTVTVFSRQVKEESLKLSQLPPAFAEELTRWSEESSVPAVTTRYFIGGTDRKILLEHDEDYCAPGDGRKARSDCEQMNADAADIDLDAAYYLEQTNHATNATAWMINGPDQVAWIEVRDNTCQAAADRLGCRIRITRERVHVIINRHSLAQLPHPQSPHK
jgi:uncharacterized protein YecT (DUF1311 family)